MAKKKNIWIYLSAILLTLSIVSITHNFILLWKYEDLKERLERFGEEIESVSFLRNNIEDYKLICNDSLSNINIHSYLELIGSSIGIDMGRNTITTLLYCDYLFPIYSNKCKIESNKLDTSTDIYWALLSISSNYNQRKINKTQTIEKICTLLDLIKSEDYDAIDMLRN